MSDFDQKPNPQDRIITTLHQFKMRLMEMAETIDDLRLEMTITGSDVDKWIEYLEGLPRE